MIEPRGSTRLREDPKRRSQSLLRAWGACAQTSGVRSRVKVGVGEVWRIAGDDRGRRVASGLHARPTCSRPGLQVRRDVASPGKELRGRLPERAGTRDRQTQVEPPRRGGRELAPGLAGRRGPGLCPVAARAVRGAGQTGTPPLQWGVRGGRGVRLGNGGALASGR